MGCSESSNAVDHSQRKIQKEEESVKQTLPPPERHYFLIGSSQENQNLFAKVKLPVGSLQKLSIPENFQPMNHCSMLQVAPGRFFISGGISSDLTTITPACYIYETVGHSVRVLAPLKQPRYTHSTLSFGDYAYAFGGRYFGGDEKGLLQSCEKYCFSKNVWQILPQLNIARCTCFAFIWEERIYLLGGYTGKFERSPLIERLDEKGGRWEILPFQLNRGIESGFMIATALDELTIFGGSSDSGPSASVLTINLREETVRSRQPLRDPKTLHKCFREQQLLFIFGGSDENKLEIYGLEGGSELISCPLSQQLSIDVLDILSQSETTIQVPSGVKKETKIQSKEGDEILLFFGNTQDPFILELNLSAPFSNILAVPLSLKLFSGSGGVHLESMKYLLFGGIEDDSQDSLPVVRGDTYLYDHTKKCAEKLSSMITNRYSFAWCRIGEDVYVLGGGSVNKTSKLSVIDKCQVFSMQNKTWRIISDLPKPIKGAMSLHHKGNIYVFGGLALQNQPNKTIFKYDIIKNSWKTLTVDLSFGLEESSLLSINNEIFLFGGKKNGKESNTIWSMPISENGECKLQERSEMREQKSKVKAYQPKQKDFFVVLGGKEIIQCFDCKKLKKVEPKELAGLQKMFIDKINQLNSKDVRNSLMISKAY